MLFERSTLLKNPIDSAALDGWVTEAAKGKVRYELLWKGNRDGFYAGTFHSRCNNKGPTVTVILSNNDKIFGGYTSQSWTNGGWKQDATAFIYSLTHKAKCATQKNTGYSIYDYSDYGPTFGNGGDIYVADNCNTNTSNYCESQSSSSTYTLPSGADNTFLAGSLNFTVKEIEVYAVIKQ